MEIIKRRSFVSRAGGAETDREGCIGCRSLVVFKAAGLESISFRPHDRQSTVSALPKTSFSASGQYVSTASVATTVLVVSSRAER